MGSSQSTQKDNFVNQANKFYSNKSQSYCVELWQQGENDKMIYDETITPQGVMPHDHDFVGMPVFQKEVQDGWGVVQVKTPAEGGTRIMDTESAKFA